jgi:hypothetical protein
MYVGQPGPETLKIRNMLLYSECLGLSHSLPPQPLPAGELAYADFVKPDGEDNPDYTKAIIQVSKLLPARAWESSQNWQGGHAHPLQSLSWSALRTVVV